MIRIILTAVLARKKRRGAMRESSDIAAYVCLTDAQCRGLPGIYAIIEHVYYTKES
jgi:hypothetical protein